MATRPEPRREDVELLRRLGGTVLLAGEVAHYIRLKTWEKLMMFFLVILGVLHFAYSVFGITPAELAELLARIRPAPESLRLFSELYFHLFYKYYLGASIIAALVLSHKRRFLPEYVYDLDAIIHLIGGFSGYEATGCPLYLLASAVCGVGQLLAVRLFLIPLKARLIELLVTMHREGIPVPIRPRDARELGIPEDIQRELGILPRPWERREQKQQRQAEAKPRGIELMTTPVMAESRESNYV